MSEFTKKLVKLLESECSIEVIKKKMNLSDSQLAYRLFMLKYQGYTICNKYYGNGDITASFGVDRDDYAKIYTKYNENFIRFLAIADLHYFHKDENRRSIDRVFNYCIKNGINIIFICGDLIDAMNTNLIPLEEQTERFTQLYPHDNSIINFCVLGNHDYKTLCEANIDLKKVIENKRLDIVAVDYVDSKICIKNDFLFLTHPINNISSTYKNEKGSHLILRGHSHTMKVKDRCIYVPSLSNVEVRSNKDFIFIPQALDCTLYFSKNKAFKGIVVNQLLMEKEPYVINELAIELNSKRHEGAKLEVNEYPSFQKVKTKK